MSPGEVEVYVEELILYGVSPRDRYHLAGSLERELGRLLAGQVPASLTRPARIGHMDAGQISVARAAPARRIGADIAGAIFRGLSR